MTFSPRDTPRKTPRTTLRVTLVAVVAGALTLLGAGVASAHNSLIGSTPAAGAQLTAGPAEITLSFDQPVQNYEPIVTVTGPPVTEGGPATRWEAGKITILDGNVTATVNPLGPAGEYIIGYRIISADGHPVTGDVRFNLTTAGTGTPNVVAAVESSSEIPVWVWVVGGVVVLVILGGGAVLTTRRRTS
ncbi:copper resistance protein CopC [Nakamurella silvestris]|nr:copper resistance protein CopC [Nakamurella silvestris]